MYKEDLALNNLQWLICNRTKEKQSKANLDKSVEKNKRQSLGCFGR